MRRLLLLLLLFSALNAGAVADSLDINDAIYQTHIIVSVNDYKAAVQEHLGEYAGAYIRYVDSVAAAGAGKTPVLDKDYCQSVSIYSSDHYTLLDRALMDVFRSKKARLVNNGKSFGYRDVRIRKKRLRGLGTVWVIKDLRNRSTDLIMLQRTDGKGMRSPGPFD